MKSGSYLFSLVISLFFCLSFTSEERFFTSKNTAAGFQETKTNDASSVLNIFFSPDPLTLNPYQNSSSSFRGRHIPLLYMPLSYKDEQGKLVPGLAKSWETSADGKTRTFHLRDDVWWLVSGKPEPKKIRPVDGQDLIAGIKYAFWDGKNSWGTEWGGSHFGYMDYSKIKGFKEYLTDQISIDQIGLALVDDFTVEIGLEQPFSEFPTGAGIYALPQEELSHLGTGWSDTWMLATNSAYYLTSDLKENPLVLKKNPFYPLSTRIDPEQINIFTNLTPNQVLKMYNENQLDIAFIIQNEIDKINQNSPLINELYLGPQIQRIALVFNTQKAPFNNVNMIKAFQFATDLTTGLSDDLIMSPVEYINFASIPWWIDANSAMKTDVPACLPGDNFNPFLANVALELAGGQNEILSKSGGISMAIPGDELSQKVAGLLQESWKKHLGKKIELMPLENFAQKKPGLSYDLTNKPPLTSAGETWNVADWDLAWNLQSFNDLSSDDVPNIFLLNWIADSSQPSLQKQDQSFVNDRSLIIYPLFDPYKEGYLRKDLGKRGDSLFQILGLSRSIPAITPQKESCAQPSKQELINSCLKIIETVKKEESNHNCETWIPAAENALYLASAAVGIDPNLADAYYCRGIANYYLARLPQANADLQKAKKMGVSDPSKCPVDQYLPVVKKLVETPKCAISPIKFIDGWKNGVPLNPSDEYRAVELSRINVFWELNGKCPSQFKVIWKHNSRTACFHSYGDAEIPHKRFEGSSYFEEGGKLLAPGEWTVEVFCGGSILQSATATIPPEKP